PRSQALSLSSPLSPPLSLSPSLSLPLSLALLHAASQSLPFQLSLVTVLLLRWHEDCFGQQTDKLLHVRRSIKAACFYSRGEGLKVCVCVCCAVLCCVCCAVLCVLC